MGGRKMKTKIRRLLQAEALWTGNGKGLLIFLPPIFLPSLWGSRARAGEVLCRKVCVILCPARWIVAGDTRL